MVAIFAAKHRAACKGFSVTDPSPRILVTGGAGFIGAHLVARLLQQTPRNGTVPTVKVVDNLWRGELRNLHDDDGAPLLNLERDVCQADLTDYAVAERMTRHATLVYHLADIVAGIDFVFSNQAFIFDTNLRINLNTVRAARRNQVPAFVYTATACSLPKQLQAGYSAVSIGEESLYPANPESSYGWSKLMGEYNLRQEQAAAKAAGVRFDVGIVRLHNVYGPRCPYRNGSQALPALIRKALRYPAEGFAVMGSGHQYRDFLYVEDAVDAIITVAERGMNREAIQVGTGEAVTLRQAAEEVVAIARNMLGVHITPSFDGAFEGDKGRVADLSSAHKLGWRAKVKFSEGMRHTFRWIMHDMGVAKKRTGRGRGHGAPAPADVHPVPVDVLHAVVNALHREARQVQRKVGTDIDNAECVMRAGGLPLLNASLLYENSHRTATRVIDAALGKMLMRFIAAVANPPSKKTRSVSTWRWTSVPSASDKWARYLQCAEGVDAWQCMFGAEQTARADCALNQSDAQVRPFHKMLAAARMIVLQGHRASPLLAPGPLPPPLPFDGVNVNISVHVRGGDACDVYEYGPLNTSLAFGRWEIIGKGLMRGHCPHPSVHLAYVQQLMRHLGSRGFRVDALLFATDSEQAQALFDNAFRNSPTRLVSRAFNRQATANNKWKLADKAESQWIEFRRFDDATGAEVTVSALEDIRLLAQAHVIVGTMCSNLAALAWNLMVAHHGWMTPYVSLDACLPQLERPKMIPPDKLHLPYSGSQYRPRVRSDRQDLP